MTCALLVLLAMQVAPPDRPPAATGMTLEAALEIASEKRADLAGGRSRVEARNADVRAAAAPWFPRLTTKVFGDRAQDPIAGPFNSFFQRDDTLTQQRLGFGVGIVEDLPTGTSLSVSTEGMMREFSYYAEALNPRFEPGVRLRISQKLWRGFGVDVNLAPLSIAEAEATIEEARQAAREQAVALEVAEAWMAASRAFAFVALRQRSVELAQQFEQLTRQLIDGGSLSRLDLALALQTVAGRKAELASAEADRDLALARLGETLGVGADGMTVDSMVIAPLAETPTQLVPLKDVIARARAASPDLRAAQAAQDRIKAEAPRRSDWWKPDVRLVVDGAVSGLAGTTTCISGFLPDGITPCHVPPAYVGGPDRALTNMASGQLYQVGVGIEGEIPVLFGPGLAAAEAADLDTHAAAADLAAAQQRIEWQARRLLRDVERRASLLTVATENVKLADEALEAEETKLRSGRSTGFALLRAQELRVGADIQHTEARYQLAVAHVRLQVIMGALGGGQAPALQ